MKDLARTHIGVSLMSDLTTEEVRDLYVYTKANLGLSVSSQFAAFDEWLNKIKADVWDERGRTLASHLGPNNGHEWGCMGYGDCYCATYPNPYRKEAND